MADLNPNIILGIQRQRAISPQEMYAQKAQYDQNELANRLGQMKIQEYEQGRADNALLRNAYKQFGADTTANVNALYKAGLGKEAAEYAKTQADIAKERATGDKAKIESVQKAIGLMGSTAYALSQSPTLNMQEVAGAVEQLKAQLPQEFHGALDISKLPQDPAGLRAALQRIYNQSIETDKILADHTSRLNNAETNATSRANNAATNSTTRRGQDLVDSRQRDANQSGKIPPGYRATANGGLEAIPGGPADLKVNAAGVAKVSDAKDVLGLLDEVDALLPKSTGSYGGAAADAVMGAFGGSTQGAQTVAQLKALQGALVSKMPKMSGPQSDKDVLLYREMAGQVGDQTIPVPQRQAASAMIRKLNEKYAGMAAGSSKKVAPEASWDAPAGGVIDFGSLK